MIAPFGFSSLAARREWLETDMARDFKRVYRKTRAYQKETAAAEIARAENTYFRNIDDVVFTKCIDAYQKIGCWPP